MKIQETLHQLALYIHTKGGRAYLVGGAVRDELMGRENKDLDVECFGIPEKELASILAVFAMDNELSVSFAGKSFKVFKLRNSKGEEIDVSLPRRDRKTGSGHTGFEVTSDPYMSIEEAAARRDFTINSIYKDLLHVPLNETDKQNAYFDPFNGQQDIKDKLIRMVDKNAFSEDPLRVLRALQFSSRFEFVIEYFTLQEMKKVDLCELPSERIFTEVEKALLQSENPSNFFNLIGYLDNFSGLFPVLRELVKTPQDYQWHPEGWSITRMPSLAYNASPTTSIGFDGRMVLSKLRELALIPTANPTLSPESNSTLSTSLSGINEFTDIQPTGNARDFNANSSPVLDPTIITQPESFVCASRNLTPGTYEGFRIVFEIPNSCMKSIVESAVNDFEVLQSVVVPVLVPMVNMLPSLQFTPEFVFLKETVNTHNTSVKVKASNTDGDVDIPVPITIIMNTEPSINESYVRFSIDVVDFVTSHVKDINIKVEVFQITEGNVFIHTMMALNEAAKLVQKSNLSKAEKLTVLLAVLCHDFGKATTTTLEDGRVRAKGHAEAGLEPTEALLDRLKVYSIDGFDVRANVLQLVEYHLSPPQLFAAKVKDPGTNVLRALRRLSQKVRLDLLGLVSLADMLGRSVPNGDKLHSRVIFDWFNKNVALAQVKNSAPKPLLMGRHLIALGQTPGVEFGTTLKTAYELQLDGQLTSVEQAIRWVEIGEL